MLFVFLSRMGLLVVVFIVNHWALKKQNWLTMTFGKINVRRLGNPAHACVFTGSGVDRACAETDGKQRP